MTVNLGASSSFPYTLPFTLGLGNRPVVRCWLSKDDVRNSTPNWIDVTSKLRSWSTSRGRENETADFDAGTAEIVLSNADKAFDPFYDPTVRARNRIRLEEEYNSTVRPIFTGYVDSWQVDYPSAALKDSTSSARCTDETKILNGLKLPVTSPPRDSFGELVALDTPSVYWDMRDWNTQRLYEGNPGPQLIWDTATGYGITLSNGNNAVIGEFAPSYAPPAGGRLTGADYVAGQDLDPTGLAAFSFEMLVRTISPAGATENLFVAPLADGAAVKFVVQTNPAGQISFLVRKTGAAYATVTYAGPINDGNWYHLVFIATAAGNANIYVNGVLAATASIAGTFATNAPTGLISVNAAANTGLYYYGPIAFYRYALSQARVLAHYQAARLRGLDYTTSQYRVSDILDVAGSHAPRVLGTGGNSIAPRYMNGQSPNEEIRVAMLASSEEAATFIGADGSVNFQALNSPTSLFTFGDDQSAIAAGSELPYLGFTRDDSDAFIVNDVTITADRPDATPQSATSSASISANERITLNLERLALVNDSVAAVLAANIVTKRAFLTHRITSIEPKMEDKNVADAIGNLELLDTCTFKSTPPGGGARYSQDLVIQRIERSGTPGAPQTCKLAVSPL